ncbi:MAG: 2Fe-2S iron-sulfur cluster-binding protein [Aggregatilineales bacterium]
MQECVLQVLIDDEKREFTVSSGSNLRKTLLERGISPYATILDKLNCGGRGLCATCGVIIEEGEHAPTHWHDRIGSRFGYPRLSCQITIETDMTVRIMTDKWIWGRRDAGRKWS